MRARHKAVALAVALAFVAPAVKPPPAEADPLAPLLEPMLVLAVKAVEAISALWEKERKKLLKDVKIEPREEDPAEKVGDLPEQ